MGELSNTTINGVSYDFKDAGAARQSHSHTKSQITDFPTSMPASDVSAWAKASTKPTYTASEVGAIPTTEKGANNGVASLDSTGKVPSSQLPSYVDDVLEYSAKSSFPSTGESGKIYVDKSNNKTYRWSGSAYVEISESLALGETSSTAYRGDRGKTAYDHSQTTSGNPHNVTKTDVGLSNVGNFKAVSTVASQGLSDTEKSNARANIGAGTSSFSGSYNDLSNKPSSLPASDVYSWAKASSKPSYTASEVGAVPNTSAGVSAAINLLSTGDSAPTDNDYYVSQYAGGGTSTTTYHRRPVSKLWDYIKSKLASKGSATQPVYFSNGVPVATTYTLGKSVPSDAKFTDTTYSAATTSAAGLMSAADKTKLNGIATGATKITVDSAMSSSSTNPVQNKVVNTALGAKMGAKNANGYWGLTSPNGTDTEWTRTSTQGIIPYQTGGAGSGHQSIGTSGWYFSHAYVDNFHGSLDGNAKTATKAASADKLKLKSVSAQASVKGWSTKTWSGLTAFGGVFIWTDGTNIYYSSSSDQYVLNKSTSTWTKKTWSGLTSFYGNEVWTDGTNIYYSDNDFQYVLNGSTWTKKTWSGMTSFYADSIWTDGTNIYFSSGSTQRVLNGSKWSTKSWSGLTGFNRQGIWTDGTDIYYSYYTDHYVLNRASSTWTKKTWSGLTSFMGDKVWTDGTNIYYSEYDIQYVLNGSTWSTKTWSGLSNFFGSNLWTDGDNIYCADGTSQYVLTDKKTVR